MTTNKDDPRIVILEPQERLKALISYCNAVEVDPHVPPRRYYRSGLEMVRMANVYLEEGSLENAYILYLKFMTLFLEKVRKHPDFATVTTQEKATNQIKLREVLPKAEKLKAQLLQKYTEEYNVYLQEEEERRKQDQKEKERRVRPHRNSSSQPLPLVSGQGKSALELGLPSKIDSVQYPDEDSDSNVKPLPASSANIKTIPSAPIFDRSSKPDCNNDYHSSSVVKGGLRTVVVPNKVMSHFLNLAMRNTLNNVETCGILAGKLERNQLIITHMILSKQKGTSDSCTTMCEEEIFNYQDQHNLITIGWIHTHPTQTAFLSSVDLHTHCPYQLLMPEAIAVVCAPKYDQTGFFTLTPGFGLEYIAGCRKTGFHPHPTDPPLFMNAEHIKIDKTAPLEVLDLRV